MWMALAMMVWMARRPARREPASRYAADSPRPIARVRRCTTNRLLLLCTDGLSSDVRVMRETFRDPMPTGSQGRPRRRHSLSLHRASREARREVHVVDVERRIIDGTPARALNIQASLTRGNGAINTAYIERLNATFRERLASLTRRGRALARGLLTPQNGTHLIPIVYF